MTDADLLPTILPAATAPPAHLPDHWPQAAARVAAGARERAAGLDHDGAFPAEDVAALAEAGLLLAPFPQVAGGAGLWGGPAHAMLARVLRTIGRGSLPLGRLYEGHVNAAALITRYGTAAQALRFAALAQAGTFFGVWNTEGADGLRLLPDGRRWRLEGRKILASGAGFVGRPLVTARRPDGAVVMVVPHVPSGRGADLSAWQAHGMRASATGALDFTDLVVEASDIVGEPGDYLRQPWFSGGAWRFAAVQAGGIEAVVEAARAHLLRTGRQDDPHQRARLADMAMASVGARLWVERAAALAEAGGAPEEEAEVGSIEAFVNLARLSVEKAGLEVIQLAQRSVGLQGFMRAHPLERLLRDLAVYLRQPKPDEAAMRAAIHMTGAPVEVGELW